MTITNNSVWKRVPFAILGWLAMIPLGIVDALVGIPAVLFSIAGDGWKRTPWLWKPWANAIETPPEYYSRWGVFWYWAIRNPGIRKGLKQPETFNQVGDIDESKPGFQWRWRNTRWLDSFRVAWGQPDKKKGKKEFYIGWRIGSTGPFNFTLQLRPF